MKSSFSCSRVSRFARIHQVCTGLKRIRIGNVHAARPLSSLGFIRHARAWRDCLKASEIYCGISDTLGYYLVGYFALLFPVHSVSPHSHAGGRQWSDAEWRWTKEYIQVAMLTFKPLARCSYSRSGCSQKQKLRASKTRTYCAVSAPFPIRCRSARVSRVVSSSFYNVIHCLELWIVHLNEVNLKYDHLKTLKWSPLMGKISYWSKSPLRRLA